MNVTDAQGFSLGLPQIVKGIIVMFYGTRLPEGWALCDGTLGTPDLRDRFIVGDTAVGAGTAGGTQSATGVTHSAFALANHNNHAATQPAAHSAHSPTQPAAHSNHVATQPGAHGIHANQGAHTHNSHTVAANGSVAATGTKLTGPATHSSDGGHTHGVDDHPHTGFTVDAHSAHSAFAVDAHSAHAGFAVDAHSAHSVGQPSTHTYKVTTLAWIMKL